MNQEQDLNGDQHLARVVIGADVKLIYLSIHHPIEIILKKLIGEQGKGRVRFYIHHLENKLEQTGTEHPFRETPS